MQRSDSEQENGEGGGDDDRDTMPGGKVVLGVHFKQGIHLGKDWGSISPHQRESRTLGLNRVDWFTQSPEA